MLFQTEREDWRFVVSATVVFALALVVAVWDFVVIQKMIYRFGVLNVIGLVLFLVGISIRVVGRITLRRYYSYGLRTLPDQKLVKHGIYRYIRHPISLAAIIYSVGIPLIFASLYGLLFMLFLIPLFLYRLRIEEKMLIDRFGDEYLEYMRKTKKMIPFVY